MLPIDHYFLKHDEPTKSCLQALREIMLASDKRVTEAWKYGMPFYCVNGKMAAYLWTHKKYKQPYIGIVEGASLHDPELLQEKRARMKILLVDPTKDIPIRKVKRILKEVFSLYD
ncbi:DUF1801 domain-containing protein [Chryseolinea lacunae]|uniref:DUF1801 domain-containing protein n=1 Tax=Chryseolinea lacunae TaxID=2801331 RepID=A0ABS1KWG1_9BACT|nr:DUF1801 domain-containing protein [Chryseolinea lacunae]MBL0743597.1 DUF1801 domain-containing protein [Chryseolinea lacunae]